MSIGLRHWMVAVLVGLYLWALTPAAPVDVQWHGDEQQLAEVPCSTC